MERLTRRMCGGFGLVEGHELSSPHGCRVVVDRLAAYEETGLEPNEVIAVKNERDFFGKGIELLHKENTEYNALGSIDRLRELAQADREGRVVVLPCKVGDTIYKIPSETNHALNKISGHAENNRVYEQKVCRAEVYENGVFCLVTCDGMDSVHSAFYNVDWFLTREEAEKALEARKGAEHDL